MQSYYDNSSGGDYDSLNIEVMYADNHIKIGKFVAKQNFRMKGKNQRENG